MSMGLAMIQAAERLSKSGVEFYSNYQISRPYAPREKDFKSLEDYLQTLDDWRRLSRAGVHMYKTTDYIHMSKPLKNEISSNPA